LLAAVGAREGDLSAVTVTHGTNFLHNCAARRTQFLRTSSREPNASFRRSHFASAASDRPRWQRSGMAYTLPADSGIWRPAARHGPP